jgi:hypothetical protein
MCRNLPFRTELTSPYESKAPLRNVSQVAKSLRRIVREVLNTPFDGPPNLRVDGPIGRGLSRDRRRP